MNSTTAWHREVMWRRDDGGVEHVRVAVVGRGVEIDGVVATRDAAGAAHRVRYRLGCDSGWCVRELRVELPEAGTALLLRSDGSGHWTDERGATLAHLDGCIDVDILAVIFTNTLPIRRLELTVGEACTMDVAFVQLPSLEVVHVQQRYTRLRDDAYRYESVSSGFRAELSVDGEGLLTLYPGLGRRLWSD